MSYLVQRQSRFYYNRRVPKYVQEYDKRPFIRIALKTDSRKIALKLAADYNAKLETYWLGLLQSGHTASEKEYNALVQKAKLLGYSYYFSPVLAEYPLNQIIERARCIEKRGYEKSDVEVVLGGKPIPVLKIEDALSRYWDFSKDKLLNKSPNQTRKWKNPRIKAIKNFIEVIGNKEIHALTRDDSLKFRDWQIEKMAKSEIISGSANKDLFYVKVIITTVAENYKINIDCEHIFKKLSITKDDSQKRLPLESEHIVNTLLKPYNLKGLNKQARWALHAFAETGAGLGELTGLLPEDIILDHDMPHIKIVPRSKKELKTKFRVRTIPLVGFALDAFKACPNGFTDYAHSADLLSNVLNKYLREHKLLPTIRHSVYSLRHSFQDRLLAVNAPDRVQADLMGHKFNRPSYGDGASLKQKLEWLEKITLKQ